ncbi:hypothetical protein ACWGDT_11110 [Streptomyces avermitilis]
MRKMITGTVTALSQVCLTAPAQADATMTEGKVSVSVKGSGLSVRRARGWMDGLGTGVRARLYTVFQGSRADLTKWKDATPRTAGMTPFSDVDWNLHGAGDSRTERGCASSSTSLTTRPAPRSYDDPLPAEQQ